MDSRNTVLTRASDFSDAEADLTAAKAVLERQRDRTDRNDPSGRHLSLAITHIEDALLRLQAAKE